MSIGNYIFYGFIYIYIVVVLFLLDKMLKFYIYSSVCYA